MLTVAASLYFPPQITVLSTMPPVATSHSRHLLLASYGSLAVPPRVKRSPASLPPRLPQQSFSLSTTAKHSSSCTNIVVKLTEPAIGFLAAFARGNKKRSVRLHASRYPLRKAHIVFTCFSILLRIANILVIRLLSGCTKASLLTRKEKQNSRFEARSEVDIRLATYKYGSRFPLS